MCHHWNDHGMSYEYEWVWFMYDGQMQMTHGSCPETMDQSPYLCVCHSTTTPLPTWTEFICKLKAVKVIMPAFGTCHDLAQVLGVIAGNHVVACFYHKSQSFCRSEVHANTHAVLGSPSPRNCNCRLQTAGKKTASARLQHQRVQSSDDGKGNDVYIEQCQCPR